MDSLFHAIHPDSYRERDSGVSRQNEQYIYNMVLSNNRVKSTNDYIISKGIDQSRIIKYEGFGETQSNYILQTATIKIWQPKRNSCCICLLINKSKSQIELNSEVIIPSNNQPIIFGITTTESPFLLKYYALI